MISRSIVCPECQQPTQVDFEIPTDITSEQYRQLGRNCQKCGARLSVKQMREAVPAQEASNLDALATARKALNDFNAEAAGNEVELISTIQVLSLFSIAESLSLMSNDLASLCDLLTDMLQQQEADRNRRDLQP